MSIHRAACAAGIAAACAALPAHAQLLGETLTFHRYYPTTSTVYGAPFTPSTVTVVAGPGDDASWSSYLTFMPEAATITLQIHVLLGMLGGGATFDGFAVSGFSFSPASAYVAGNSTGGDIELSVDGNALYIDFTSSYPAFAYPAGSTVVIAVPVPEPATWALFGAGASLLGALARRRRGR